MEKKNILVLNFGEPRSLIVIFGASSKYGPHFSFQEPIKLRFKDLNGNK